MSTLVSEAELLDKTGYESRGWLEKWLRENKIKYWKGRDGKIVTTIGLMEASKLGKDGSPHDQQAVGF